MAARMPSRCCWRVRPRFTNGARFDRLAQESQERRCSPAAFGPQRYIARSSSFSRYARYTRAFRPATAERRTRSSARRLSGALSSAHREPFSTAASAEPFRSRASVRRTSWTASFASFTTSDGEPLEQRRERLLDRVLADLLGD